MFCVRFVYVSQGRERTRQAGPAGPAGSPTTARGNHSLHKAIFQFSAG